MNDPIIVIIALALGAILAFSSGAFFIYSNQAYNERLRRRDEAARHNAERRASVRRAERKKISRIERYVALRVVMIKSFLHPLAQKQTLTSDLIREIWRVSAESVRVISYVRSFNDPPLTEAVEQLEAMFYRVWDTSRFDTIGDETVVNPVQDALALNQLTEQINRCIARIQSKPVLDFEPDSEDIGLAESDPISDPSM